MQVFKPVLSEMIHRLHSETPHPPLGKTTRLHHRRWLPCAQRIRLKTVKFRSVIYFGTAKELHYLIIHIRTVLMIAVCYNAKVT